VVGAEFVAAAPFVMGGVWIAFIRGFADTASGGPGMAATRLGEPAVAMRAGARPDNFHARPVL